MLVLVLLQSLARIMIKIKGSKFKREIVELTHQRNKEYGWAPEVKNQFLRARDSLSILECLSRAQMVLISPKKSLIPCPNRTKSYN